MNDTDIMRVWAQGGSPFFGERYDAPSHDHATQCPTPVGRLCYLCDRAIEDGDQGWFRPMVSDEYMPGIGVVHLGCEMGSTIGHTFGYCNCTGYEDYYERGVKLLKHLAYLKLVGP